MVQKAFTNLIYTKNDRVNALNMSCTLLPLCQYWVAKQFHESTYINKGTTVNNFVNRVTSRDAALMSSGRNVMINDKDYILPGFPTFQREIIVSTKQNTASFLPVIVLLAKLFSVRVNTSQNTEKFTFTRP
jgi:hypothetical protein